MAACGLPFPAAFICRRLAAHQNRPRQRPFVTALQLAASYAARQNVAAQARRAVTMAGATADRKHSGRFMLRVQRD
jgi:hypothetical protein